MMILPKKNLVAENFVLALLLPAIALVGIALAWLLDMWRPDFLWVPVVTAAPCILALYLFKTPKIGTLHIREDGLAVTSISGDAITWASVSEISYSEAAPKKPAFLIIEPAPGHLLPVPDLSGNTLGNPPMVFNRSGSLFINLSFYQERPAEIFFLTRKALVRFRSQPSAPMP